MRQRMLIGRLVVLLLAAASPNVGFAQQVGPVKGALVIAGGAMRDATIIKRFMLVRGDTKSNETMIGDHTDGFGFLRNVGIDQHVLVRNRQFDMLEVIEKYPALLGIAIDENTAIVVQGDRFEVIGDTYVLIFDTTRVIPPRGQFYFLKAGDTYDLAKREAGRPSANRTAIGRVKPVVKPGH